MGGGGHRGKKVRNGLLGGVYMSLSPSPSCVMIKADVAECSDKCPASANNSANFCKKFGPVL